MKRIILLFICLTAATASAQVQVVEASGNQTPSRARPATANNNSNELLLSLYNQLEAMQQEVQSLRGLAEEQAHKIRTLENQTRERYLDIDRRLIAISSTGENPNAPISTSGAQPGTTVETRVGDVRTTVPFNPVLQATTTVEQPAGESVIPSLAIDQLSEQDLYRTALNLLLEEGNHTDSVMLFQAYAQRFPEGRLLPNALYWMGEANILLTRYPQARQAFERVLQDFPEDPKAAGSMLKLGVVLNLMGDRASAEQTWRDLSLRYPDSTSENTLAKDYLNRR